MQQLLSMPVVHVSLPRELECSALQKSWRGTTPVRTVSSGTLSLLPLRRDILWDTFQMSDLPRTICGCQFSSSCADRDFCERPRHLNHLWATPGDSCRASIPHSITGGAQTKFAQCSPRIAQRWAVRRQSCATACLPSVAGTSDELQGPGALPLLRGLHGGMEGG